MRRLTDHLPKLLSALAVAVGLAAAGLGLSVFVEAWQTSHAWAGSAEALHADLPAEAPIWLDQPADSSSTGGTGPASLGKSSPGQTDTGAASTDAVVVRGVGTATEGTASQGAGNEGAMEGAGIEGAMNRAPTAESLVGARLIATTPPAALAPAGTTAVPAPTGTTADGQPSGAAAGDQPSTAQPGAVAAPVNLPAPGDVELAEADFRFLDPPEPGAHARLAVTLQSHADRPTGPLIVTVPARWLQSYTIFGAIPPVLDDHPGPDGDRQLVFDGLAPGERRTFEVHVLASAEEVDGPAVSIGLSDGAEIGRAQPRTVAPRPRPGPARAVTIPKLGVRAAVVPVPWEPPPFVVGQLQGTAAVSEGNTVLVGHLRGAAGDVFARLDRLQPGDEVVAMSRGLEYRFVVSEVAVRPYDDVQEARPTDTPRLTMMTCTGTWNIARQDYSHRLWVVAEPPELAEQTIRANADLAAQAAREAEAAAAARAAHEAEVAATPALEAVTATTSPPEAEIVEAGASAPAAPVAQATSPPAAAPVPAPPDPPVLAEAAPTPTRAAPTPAAATPPPAPSATVAVAEPRAAASESQIVAPGIVVDAPAEGAGVPRRLVVRGRRTPDADARRPLWLVVRADVAGSRWYALDRPLDIRPDGTWETTVDLGGATGIHHELRVGAVDAATEAALRRHAAEHPGQPLDDLPPGFRTGARVVVERR